MYGAYLGSTPGTARRFINNIDYNNSNMNKDRRKRIQNIIDRLTDLETEIEKIQDEEQEAYDNLPESLQECEKGERMSDAIDSLDHAFCSVGDTISYLDEVIQ